MNTRHLFLILLVLVSSLTFASDETNISTSINSARADFPTQEEQQELNEKWEHVLPFHAQDAIDLGYKLPLPFSITLVPNSTSQQAQLHSLSVNYKGVELGEHLDLSQVDLGQPTAETSTLQLRLGAWVLPNLQMGVHVGRFKGDTELNISIPTSIFEGVNNFCSKFPERDSCKNRKESINVPAFYPEFEGLNWGFSANWVGTLGDFTYVVPISLTDSETDDGKTLNRTTLITPRIGQRFHSEDYGSVFAYVGAVYMVSEGVSSEEDALGVEDLSYSISQHSVDEWAAVFGYTWLYSDSFSGGIEYVSGEGRNIVNVMLTASF